MASSSSSPSAADSYIGSVISLTSKFEIRYEGVFCSLNPENSTLGLKNVVSYGTEGRKKDGPEIPPSDKVYEYILFRGSDIKDLQVKSSPPPIEESIYSDPAIIESQFASGNSVSSKPVALNNGPVVESIPYQESSEVKTNFYSSLPLPPQNSYNPQAYALSADWPGPMISNATTQLSQTQFSNSLAPIPSLSSSNSLNSYAVPPVPPGQLISNPMNGKSLPPMMASLPTTYSPVVSGINSANVESINFNESISSQSLSYGGSSMMNSINGGFLKHSSFLMTPDQLLQPRLSEFPPPPTFCPDDKKMPIVNSSQQFTEEFDFEAMNQKFNKNEIWGFLGSSKLNNKGERINDKDTISQLKVNNDDGSLMPLTAADSKPAYNKDDFFDTISSNSTSHRGRNRQNHYSDRMRPDSRTYDDFQQRSNQEYGGYGGGRVPYYPRGGYNSGGRGGGYNSGGRGRGGNVQW